MIYEAFLNTVKEQMALSLGKEYQLTLRKVPKNNGLILDGLCISRGSSSVAPAIYLNSCYDQYKKGRPLADITAELLSLYQSHDQPPLPDCSRLSDFSAMKPRIAARLIHRESNTLLLEQIPHIPWLDLEAVFYLCLQEDDQSLMTALIHNEHLKIWNTTPEELWQIAMENSPRIFPPVISSMACILEELMEENGYELELPDLEAVPAPFYVLTNTCGIHGAVCMLYKDVLKNFAEGTERDLIILPSSIHEVLILPDDGDISYEEMSRLVTQINDSEVPASDRLSNQIYLYTRTTGTITLASHNCCTSLV